MAKGNPPSPADPMQRASVSQAAAAKMALANVLLDEPGLPRAASVPRSVPASPALSGGAMSSLAASPLPGAQAPSVQGAAPAKKLSFFENSLFSQVRILCWLHTHLVLVLVSIIPLVQTNLFQQPLALPSGMGDHQEAQAGDVSCATTPLAIAAAAAQWQEEQAAAAQAGVPVEEVDLGAALRSMPQQQQDVCDEDWGLQAP